MGEREAEIARCERVWEEALAASRYMADDEVADALLAAGESLKTEVAALRADRNVYAVNAATSYDRANAAEEAIQEIVALCEPDHIPLPLLNSKILRVARRALTAEGIGALRADLDAQAETRDWLVKQLDGLIEDADTVAYTTGLTLAQAVADNLCNARAALAVPSDERRFPKGHELPTGETLMGYTEDGTPIWNEPLAVPSVAAPEDARPGATESSKFRPAHSAAPFPKGRPASEATEGGPGTVKPGPVGEA